ncbi:restriction endonuclease subunit S [uncultured Bacteroides sp.]|uniref:restriction endonuclease subunit S n=1 Tax=uncultured Bacteroides sp. TaxID=162156 RepID=UPI00259746D3|nr:restriction endonuclease subunit S [uncultured Bacteroides sp.]
MSEWKKVKLGELYTVHNGLSKSKDFFGSGYPFLTFSNVFNNWFLPDKLEALVQSTDKDRESFSIMRGDIFITRTSETMDELGMSSVALKDYPNATFNGFTKRLRPKNDDILPEYIGYYLRSKKFRNKFLAFSSMTTRASLANSDLLNMEVEIPNKSIQNNIAEILSRYDSLIENYQKQIKLLEESAQRLYKEWFVDLRFPRHENTKIVDGVPEGWSYMKIKDRYKTVLGGTPSRSINNYWGGDISWINSGEINKLRIINPSEKITIDGYNNSSTKLMPIHTTILAITGATLGQVSYTEIETCANQSVVGIIDEKNTTNEYLYLNIYNNIHSMINKATGGAQQHINKDIVNDYCIMLPNEDILTEFRKKIKPVFNAIRNYLFTIEKLTEARDRLLPKLMSGEIEV